MAAILVAALLGTAGRRADRRHLRLLAGSMVALELGLVLRVVEWPGDFEARVLIAGAMWVIAATGLGAMLRVRAGLPPLRRVVVVFGACTLALQAWFTFVDSNIVARIWVINGGASVIITAMILPARRLWSRGPWDRALLTATFVFAFFTLVRTVTLAGGAGDAADFSSTAVWTATHVTLVSYLLALALVALAGTLRDELSRIQTERDTDALTGLRNRRRFEELAGQVLSQPADGPVSLVFCDIDHFKAINDVHGHAAGDRVLQGFAHVLCEDSRVGDLVGRFGGEEFVMLLPGTEASQAAAIAERLRVRAGEELARTLGSGRVTASFGVAYRFPGDDLGALIDRADHQLYVAKAAGRDRVAVAAGPAAGAGHQAT